MLLNYDNAKCKQYKCMAHSIQSIVLTETVNN